MNTAIIVAAGSGKRLRSDTPKQFLKILGNPVIIHTLQRFESCPEISEIILVLARDQIDFFNNFAADYVFTKLKKVVAGGSTRAESVLEGLLFADELTEIVVVHDGARPLVSVDEIKATILKAADVGAACLVASLTDTIKTISSDEITGTLDREYLRRALTPQAFRYEILRKAFTGVDLTNNVTDECYLVEKLGQKIAYVEGSSKNIKITYPEDIMLAEAFLRSSE